MLSRVDLDCPRCNHKFDAEECTRGECPSCNNRYDWSEFDDGDGGVYFVQIWDTDSERIKASCLWTRDWVK